MTSERKRPLCIHLLPDTQDAGAENQCRYLLRGLRDSGMFDLELAYFGRGRAHGQFEQLGIPMLEIPRRRRFRFDAYGRARRLRSTYRHRPPALLHAWLPEGNVVGLLTARAWPATRTVISQRGSWNELDNPPMVRLQRLLLGRADHAVSNSPAGLEMLVWLGLARDRISVIANGIPSQRVAVDGDRERVRRELGWNGQEIVAWVGRAVNAETAAQKDLATLFAAIDSLRSTRPDVRLAMIGPTADEIEQRGLDLPDGALALGWRNDAARLLDAADAMVISSRREGNSNVAGEALLLGLPVATTNCGGHCHAVAGCGGRVVPVGAAEDLASAAAELLENPPARQAVRSVAREQFSVERMVSRYLDLYRELLSGAEPRPSRLPLRLRARARRSPRHGTSSPPLPDAGGGRRS